MSSANVPKFFSQPFRFLRYASHEHPHIVLAFVLGISGPLAAATLYGTREKFLFKDAPLIPSSYPLPGKRNPELKGFDDE